MKRLTLTTSVSALALIGSAAFAQTPSSPSRPAAAPGTGADRCGSMMGAAKEACMRDAKAPRATDGAGNAVPNARDAMGNKGAARPGDVNKGAAKGSGPSTSAPRQVPPQGSVGPGASDPSGSDTRTGTGNRGGTTGGNAGGTPGGTSGGTTR